MANDSHTGRYPAAVEIYYSVCKPYCAFFAQNAVTVVKYTSKNVQCICQIWIATITNLEDHVSGGRDRSSDLKSIPHHL